MVGYKVIGIYEIFFSLGVVKNNTLNFFFFFSFFDLCCFELFCMCLHINRVGKREEKKILLVFGVWRFIFFFYVVFGLVFVSH